MKKVICITQSSNRLHQGNRTAPAGYGAGGVTLAGGDVSKRRGILLEFPRHSQGPLFAA